MNKNKTFIQNYLGSFKKINLGIARKHTKKEPAIKTNNIQKISLKSGLIPTYRCLTERG